MQAQSGKSALLTDLYEFTMAEAYYQNKMFAPATFSLFVRDLPPNRGYFVSAGLEDVLDDLLRIRYVQEDLDFLNSTGLFSDDFLHYLSNLRFSGEVHAIPEGRVFFKDEPVLEVTAPIIEGQLMESHIINTVNLQVSLASKAARCVYAAGGRNVVDFGLRRTQGGDAALKLARAGYIAGLSGTSNVLAGKLYGIPVSGTMAHSFITSFKEEIDAFRAFADIFGDNTVLLIDTYDTPAGAEKALRVAAEMAQRGKKLKGVRLDSGDMVKLSKSVRELFKKHGLDDISIFASGGFDEFKISRSVKEGAEIDAFGVGTKMGTSADSPYTDMAFKLVEYDERPVLKLSTGKKTLVGRKQVFRQTDGGRFFSKDLIALRDEKIAGEPLLEAVMQHGEWLRPAPALDAMHERFQKDFNALSDSIKALENPAAYPVDLAPGLEELQTKVVHAVIEKELGES